MTLAAALGQPHEDIAQMLGISRNTLEKHFGAELSVGALRANLKVGSNLFKIATADPPLPGTVTAAMFWAKTRMGWRSAPAALHDKRAFMALKVKSRSLLLRRITTAVTDRRRHQIHSMGFRRMLSRFQSEASVVEKPSTLSCTAPTLAIGTTFRQRSLSPCPGTKPRSIDGQWRDGTTSDNA